MLMNQKKDEWWKQGFKKKVKKPQQPLPTNYNPKVLPIVQDDPLDDMFGPNGLDNPGLGGFGPRPGYGFDL